MSLRVFPRRLVPGVTAAALLAALGSLLHAQAVPINNPPVAPTSILVFPQRDFVSTSGFEAGDLVTVEVFHPGSTTPASSAPDVVPQDDPATPGFDGIVEVNHPGGACWVGMTPDIRPGDRVRTTARNVSTGAIRTVDETTVANVTATLAVQNGAVIEVHGTAQNAAGLPIDIAQLAQRLVIPRDTFDLNGRRTLRATAAAGSDGTLAYDAPGSTAWTATYSGLDAADVTRALGAESRIIWLGNPVGTVEATVYEIGAGIIAGPTAPCSAPLEKLPAPPGSDLVPPAFPTGATLTATVIGTNAVDLSWPPATDNVAVTSYGVYRNGVAIANIENPNGSPNPPNTFQDFNVPPGTYAYSVDAADAIGNRSPALSATVTTKAQQADALPICTATPDATCVSEPPAAAPTQVQIIPFPARDFTSSSGYTENVWSVTVQVIRNGFLISTANVKPVDDPTTVGFDGIVEVNHPGGGCWVGVTPEIRANDIVRQIAWAADGSVMRIDQTHVSNVMTERSKIVKLPSSSTISDGAVEVHGTAMGADGAPIPLGQITQRLVAPRDRFDFNGRRTLRAGLGEDFALSYDTTNNPDGTKWTAIYSGLDEDDVYRAVGGTTSGGRTFPGAESRILFLGLPTAVAPEITIYENSDATISGPSAGACAAPLEPLDTLAPSAPTLTADRSATIANAAQLSWTPSTDATYVLNYGIYRDGERIHNVAGTVTSYLDENVAAGNHTYSVDAVDSASPLKVNYPPIANDPNAADPILQGVPYGNRSAKSNDVLVSQPDVLAPSVPTNLVGVVQAGVGVTLTWTASTDDVGVTGYDVYRDGVLLGTASGATYSDSTTTPGTYTYTVDAADAAGNRSAQSAPVTVVVTTAADTVAPTQPTNFAANTRDVYSTPTAPAIAAKDVALSWTASTDNSGVAGYGIYRREAASLNPTAPFTKIADVNGSTLAFIDRNLALGTYDYTVDAVDSTGNRSLQARVAVDVVTVNDPPQGSHSIIPFPARDFVSSSGYTVSEGPITITVIRGGKVWARSTPVDVVEDPATPGRGAAEVNHPGGGCWDPANGGITPDLRPGDIVRFTNRFGKADQTTTANVWADRATDRASDGSLLAAGVIQVHGTAQDTLGNPLPIDQVESRLIASSATPFALNGRRILRALGDGTIAYDAVNPVTNPKGTHWTATYAGLGAADADLARAAESRAVWLGRDPIALTELTIFENGDGVVGGPAAGVCTAPAEAGPAAAFAEEAPFAASFDPAALTVAFPAQGTGASSTQTLVLTNVGTAEATRAITGTLSIASTRFEFADAFSITSNTCTGVSLTPGSTCSVAVSYTPTTAGDHVGRLLFVDDANNSPVQALALSGSAFDAQAPSVTAPAMTFMTRSPLALATNTLSATVTATATDASGVASMLLQQSTDGGRTWKDVSPATVVTTVNPARITATLTVTTTLTYQFRAIATDGAGNTSAPVSSPAIHMSVSDDNSGVPKFSGSWSTQRNNSISSGAYGNTVHEATAPQPGKSNTVTFTFSGTEVALLAALGPDRGQVTMSVDGGGAQTIDLYASAQQQAVVAGTVSGLTLGTHTATVTVLSSRNGSSTGTRVDLDAFVVKF